MKKITLVEPKNRIGLATMTSGEIENWFASLDFAVEVVSNCGDAFCPNCRTIEPARAA